MRCCKATILIFQTGFRKRIKGIFVVIRAFSELFDLILKTKSYLTMLDSCENHSFSTSLWATTSLPSPLVAQRRLRRLAGWKSPLPHPHPPPLRTMQSTCTISLGGGGGGWRGRGWIKLQVIIEITLLLLRVEIVFSVYNLWYS